LIKKQTETPIHISNTNRSWFERFKHSIEVDL